MNSSHEVPIEKRYAKKQVLSKWQERFYFLKSRYLYAVDYYYLQSTTPDLVVVWNGLKYRQSIFLLAANKLQIKTCFMENGLLPDTTVVISMVLTQAIHFPGKQAFILR